MSTMTMTDDDTPTSAYATPMSSIISLHPVPDSLDENRAVYLFLASPPAWAASPPLSPHLPISSPMHYPTTSLPNSPNTFCFTPNSLPTTPVSQPLPASTSSVPFTYSPSTPLPSPRIRKPRFSTRMGSFSPISSNNSAIPPHLVMHHNTSTSTSTIIPPSPPITQIASSTPIPMPPTPVDLPPIPPELPLCPKLVNQLLSGPVLQTVPLPDVE